MIKTTVNQIAEIVGGHLIGEGNISIETISTDTRQAVESGLFFALKGEKFDAHNYLDTALKQGCVAVVVEREMAVSVPQIVVVNCRLALGKLAKWLKSQLNPKTVAITGSSGKTTVKEMTAKILQKSTACEDDVLYTFGNLNNELGVPLTLLRLTTQHQFAVIELGANHLGEIAYTTDLTQPDACVVNNVAAAHLEGFGSLEGVAQAKGEIYQGLKPNGVAIVNGEYDYPEWRTTIGKHALQRFSMTDSQADYWAENIQLDLNGSHFTLHTPKGKIDITLPYLGKHNVSNALAAAALAMAVGADLESVKAGLAQRSLVKGRLYPIQIAPQCLLIDDSYNANVDSMKSAISVLQRYSAFRILVAGDMAELGEDSARCHQEVADFALKAQLDLVVSFGQQSRVISQQATHHFTNKSALTDFLLPIILQKIEENQPLVLLVKGSRSQKLDELIGSLCRTFNVSF